MTTVTSTLSSPGVGSGLDVNAIVSKLMAVERQPLDAITTNETAIQSRISAYGTLKSALASLQGSVAALASPTAFRSMTANIGDTSVASATLGDGAVASRYSLEVSQLAQSHKVVSNGFASTSTSVGTGTLNFSFGTFAAGTFTTNPAAGAATVTIAPGQDSLAGIRDAVNAANVGVTATVVNDGTAAGQRLVFTSTASGAANSLKITVGDGDGTNTDTAGLSQLAYDPAATAGAGRNLTEKVAAQDALLKLDGIDVQSSSNTVKDAAGGVTLTLAKTNVGTPTTLTVAASPGPAIAAVNGFVSAYNAAQATIANLTKYDAVNKKASVLTGDGTVRQVQSQLRSLLGGTIAGASSDLNSLALVGIKTNTDGTLVLDGAKFNAALASNPHGVEQLFAATGSSTDSLIGYSAAGAKTVPGTYPVTVTQLASQGTLAGSAPAGLTITAGANDALSVVVDNVTVSVTLGARAYANAADLSAEIASKVNGALAQGTSGSGVAVTADALGVLTITSKRYGSGSSLSVSGSAAVAALGGAPVAQNGVDVAGTINGVAAVGTGQTLTGAAGEIVEGLKLLVNGGVLGTRGSVTYAQGAGFNLNKLLAGLIASDGPVAARTDGLAGSIKDMDNRKDALSRRLDLVQAAYLRQFNALDTELAQLSTTSTYLTQQLANLPKIGNGA